MTLLELLVVIAVVGTIAAITFLSAAQWRDRASVEAAAGRLLEAYRRTQSVARVWGRPAELLVTPDSLVIRAVWLSESTEVWRGPGPSLGGVALAPSRHVAAFLPNGLAMASANVTHVLTRGSAHRRVIVSRIGRVRVGP